MDSHRRQHYVLGEVNQIPRRLPISLSILRSSAGRTPPSRLPSAGRPRTIHRSRNAQGFTSYEGITNGVIIHWPKVIKA